MNRRLAVLLLTLALPSPLAARQSVDSLALARSVDQLRTSVGVWDVTTDLLNPDGSVANSVAGTYQFDWVVEDRVVSGKSEVPALGQASGILFYVNEAQGKIEMVSVGADGRLWIMSGPLGDEIRTTQEFPTADGGTARLRFTRFNVSQDAFESRMEVSADGGVTWVPGNHQQFRRSTGPGS